MGDLSVLLGQIERENAARRRNASERDAAQAALAALRQRIRDLTGFGRCETGPDGERWIRLDDVIKHLSEGESA